VLLIFHKERRKKFMSDQKVLLGSRAHPVRLNYTHLVTPSALVINGQAIGDPVYSCTVSFSKDDQETLVRLRSALLTAWKEANPNKPFPKDVKNGLPLHDSDKEAAEKGIALKEEFKNTYYVRVKSTLKNPPYIIDEYKRAITNPTEGSKGNDIYNGVEAVVEASVFVYNTGLNAGISLWFLAVQTLHKGEEWKSILKSDLSGFEADELPAPSAEDAELIKDFADETLDSVEVNVDDLPF
jgi:hypothetical protein